MQKLTYSEIKELGYSSLIEKMIIKLNETEIKPRDFDRFLFDDRNPGLSFMGGICTSYPAIEYLKNVGLLNNGICPLCGSRPIDGKYTFTSGFNRSIVFHICKNCCQDGNQISVNSNDQGGCYIATACYGDYNSDEVLIFRKFRDNFLSKYVLGRGFINIYYLLSPAVAKRLMKSKNVNIFIKINFLDKVYRKLKIKYTD